MTSNSNNSSRLDQRRFELEFILVVAGGSAGIALLHQQSGMTIITWMLPVALIVGFAIRNWGVTDRERLELSADNCYYIGFVFTLVSLASTLWHGISTGGALERELDRIVAGFGVALFSTITGVVTRAALVQRAARRGVSAPDSLEIVVDEARRAAIAARTLGDDVARNLEGLDAAIERIVTERIADATLKADESAQTRAVKIAASFGQEMDRLAAATITAQREALLAGAEDIRTLFSAVAEAHREALVAQASAAKDRAAARIIAEDARNKAQEQEFERQVARLIETADRAVKTMAPAAQRLDAAVQVVEKNLRGHADVIALGISAAEQVREAAEHRIANAATRQAKCIDDLAAALGRQSAAVDAAARNVAEAASHSVALITQAYERAANSVADASQIGNRATEAAADLNAASKALSTSVRALAEAVTGGESAFHEVHDLVAAMAAEAETARDAIRDAAIAARRGTAEMQPNDIDDD